jgi:phosphatidylethanolamine/phosphatidyl-N-methylethanolamine N-methyltransferase
MMTSQHPGTARGSNQFLSYALFLREYVRNPRATASVCPSSPALSRRMAESIDFRRARTVVELGAGTGAVTHAILGRLPRTGRLFAVDNNPSFVEHLQQRFPDRRLVAICGQAEQLAETLGARGIDQVDVIVSSLGFTNMLPETRSGILNHIVGCLKPDGVLIQYQYFVSRWQWLTVTGRGHWPFEAEELLRTCFGSVATTDVILNIPPARVFVCSKPFAGTAEE